MNSNRGTSLNYAIALGLVFVAVACTSGNGEVSVPFSAPRDVPVNDRQSAAPTRDNPGNDRQSSGNDRQDPGSDRDPVGGGSSGGRGAGSCPACDTTYDCTGTVNGEVATGTITLETSGGECVVAQKPFIFQCNGRLVATSSTGSDAA